MRITQVRNATQIIEYGSKRLLIDPMLADKGAYPGLEGTENAHIRNPTVDLPMAVEYIIDVDAVLLTHLHPDHWDEAAATVIPKDKTIFVQNENDRSTLHAQGFRSLHVYESGFEFNGMSITPTKCQHGPEEAFEHEHVAQVLGEVTGVVFSHPDEEKLYLVGDSIWTDHIKQTMLTERPGVVILNAGYAKLNGVGPIIMGPEDVKRTHYVLPFAKIIATHLGALNHVTVTVNDLLHYVSANNLDDYVVVPRDGETVLLT